MPGAALAAHVSPPSVEMETARSGCRACVATMGAPQPGTVSVKVGTSHTLRHSAPPSVERHTPPASSLYRCDCAATSSPPSTSAMAVTYQFLGNAVIRHVAPLSSEAITPLHSPVFITLKPAPCSEEVAPPQPAQTLPARVACTAEMDEQVTGWPSITLCHTGTACDRVDEAHTPPFTEAANHVLLAPSATCCTAPAEVNLRGSPLPK